MPDLVCTACGQTRPVTETAAACACGGLWDLDFQGEVDPGKAAARPWDMWRYAEALPVPASEAVTLGEGGTPLVQWTLRGRRVLIKQEQLFPTGSYKDRGAAMLVSRMKALGVTRCVEDSSGNAGCAVAAYCARAMIACRILVPEATSPAKLEQIKAYGADLALVPGNREATARAALQEAQQSYYASHVYDPFFFQGTKTFAFELAEQLGWRAPDACVLPAGNGTLLLGAYKGFSQLKRQGLINGMPRLVAVQAAHCAPLAQAFSQGLDAPAPITPIPTLAEGIAIAEPMRGAAMLAAVRDTGGEFVAVGEDEIAAARDMAHASGFYIEPTAAAPLAGLLRVMDQFPPEATITTVFTGHGLKAAGHQHAD